MLAVMRVAHTPRTKDQDTGQWTDGKTEYYDVTVWRGQAENVIESLDTGDRVVIAGTWQWQHYTDGQGQRQARKVLAATDVGASLMFRQVRIMRTQRAGGKG